MALEEGKLFYSITEVSQHLGVSASTLRFWEKEIPKLKPRTNKKGNRQYTSGDIEKLTRIKFLVKDQGHTLAGAKEKLKSKSSEVDSKVEVIEKLANIRNFLAELLIKIK
jgi:DNA-binding transcriptional MerR regulator